MERSGGGHIEVRGGRIEVLAEQDRARVKRSAAKKQCRNSKYQGGPFHVVFSFATGSVNPSINESHPYLCNKMTKIALNEFNSLGSDKTKNCKHLHT
jgi:hypothetical protein